MTVSANMRITLRVFEGHKKGGLVRKAAGTAKPNTREGPCVEF